MKLIGDIAALEALYDAPVKAALDKVAIRLTPQYRRWIEAARFCVLSSVGPEGTDGSPRGDDGPVVMVEDEKTLLMPDWRGNNRIDTLRNIVLDGRVSLMFMVPGAANVVRVNGRAVLAVEPRLLRRFEKAGKLPGSVLVVTVGEIYFQCAKAIMRSGLWRGAGECTELPTAGEMIRAGDPEFDAESYDDGYAEYARPRMW